MKTVGIIAEYNPFHNGHAYQINKAKEETGADFIIVAMSGDFLQRGVPAMLDKYDRARMALLGGADLVLELPAGFATASAEYFAKGGVELLGKTGIVSEVCYGCEQVAPRLMHALSALLADESGAFQDALKNGLKNGLSFPLARSESASRILAERGGFDEKEVKCFLSSPNNILALEYEKALSARSMKGHPIARLGGGYHSTGLPENEYASASAIRRCLLKNKAASVISHVPLDTYEILIKAAEENRLISENDFSSALYARLWSLSDKGYSDFADCGEQLSNRIANNLDSFISFEQFAGLIKSRDITYTRVCRALLHIMLDIRQYETDIQYLRVLGFRKESSALLSAIKKEASAPLITKMADASDILTDEAMKALECDIKCADLYRTISSVKSGSLLPTEYTGGIVMV